MTIIIWSLTNGGSAIESEHDCGQKSNGQTTDVVEFFVRHDGSNPITAAGIYIQPFTGTYAGRSTAAQDFAELLTWGGAGSTNSFGGVQFNFNATAPSPYPAADWPTVSNKVPTNGSAVYSGVGDGAGAAITLPTVSGCTSAGVIPNGSSPNVRFQCRVQIPADLTTTGIRMFEIRLKYTATS